MNLSSYGMECVVESDEGDFSFFIGSREYKCCVLQASFLSPRVSSLLSMDRSPCCFDLYVDDPDDCFGGIMSSGSGKALVVTKRNQMKKSLLQYNRSPCLQTRKSVFLEEDCCRLNDSKAAMEEERRPEKTLLQDQVDKLREENERLVQNNESLKREVGIMR